MTKLIHTSKNGAPAPYRNLQMAMESLFDDFFPNFTPPRWSEPFLEGLITPKTDITESDTAYELHMEIPGVEEDAIEVSISKGVLTVKAEKHAEKEEKSKQYHRVERSYGTFQRSLYLSEDIDQDQVKASYKAGVLEVIIPKSPKLVKETKKITVRKG